MKNTFNVKFEVKNINYADKKTFYTIMTAKILSHDCEQQLQEIMSIKGVIPSAYKKDTFTAEAELKLSEVYGYSLEVTNVVKENSNTNKSIIDFLTSKVSRLGKKAAEKIVKELGIECLSQIEKDYTCLLSIKGISEKRAIDIQSKIIEFKGYEKLATFITSLAVETSVANKVYAEFKEFSIIKIKENPYSICKIKGLDFTIADKIAVKLGFKADNVERVKEGLKSYIDNTIRNGDICTYKSEMLDNFSEYLNKVGSFGIADIDVQTIEKALKELLEKKELVIELNDNGKECIYRADYNYIENNIVRQLKRLIEDFKAPFCTTSQIDDFIKEYEAKYLTLADRQKEAVYVALQSGFSILTGGPGTGKTQTTNTIIKAIESVKHNATITLLAPTGKASKRMTELTAKNASTIHRELGLNGFEDFNEVKEITSDFVVIDESSMVDGYIFSVLLSNISENTRVILVGDHEQLPSVGAGLILRDLIDSGKIPVVKLDKIFRQAENSQIVMNSHKLIKGVKTTDNNGITFDHSKGDFYFIDCNDRLRIRDLVIASVERMINNQGYKLSDICILSPMRKGDIGTVELNKIIQQKFNKSIKSYEINEINCFKVGDRVMQTVNNYNLKVFNGEVGVIVDIVTESGEEVIEVEYSDKDNNILYTAETIDELELAYAITIHKSQGSEFHVVIMLIHGSQMGMLNRNLIYTGWTRAKEKVVCIGSKETLDKAIDKADDIKRNSRLVEKIIKSIK